METPTKIKLFAAIAVIAGPFLTYSGHQEKERLARLEKEGVTVDGIIEGGEWKRGKNSNYQFDVSYTPQSSAPVKQTFKVTSNYFSAHASDTAVTDPVAKVRYLPSAIQDSAILVGGSTDFTAGFNLGIGAFVGGLLTMGIMYAGKW
ncbi:DUF3592 domain-containing protein [Prosthecobacter sp.]|jgi:hypothetical protein|uniref:DUF3592 domain-containing protein n=1 Tax=Prosthecobacter sp. TaxID=1965333 RepID=UPI003784485F